MAAEVFNAVDFLQKVGKGKPVAGVVEAVLNGSTLRVTLLPDLTSVGGQWGGQEGRKGGVERLCTLQRRL